MFLIACSTGIIYLGVYGFMGTFLAEKCGLASTQAGLLMMFYGLACLAGGSLSGRIGAARGQAGVILVGEVSGIAACALLAASTLTGSWAPALIAAACLGLGYILVQPTLVALSMDVGPGRAGLCTGLIGLGVFAGGGVGSVIGGSVIGAGGYLALWLAAGIALAVQAVIGARAPRCRAQQKARLGTARSEKMPLWHNPLQRRALWHNLLQRRALWHAIPCHGGDSCHVPCHSGDSRHAQRRFPRRGPRLSPPRVPYRRFPPRHPPRPGLV